MTKIMRFILIKDRKNRFHFENYFGKRRLYNKTMLDALRKNGYKLLIVKQKL